MKHLLKITIIPILLILMVSIQGCGKDDEGSNFKPGSMTATINGITWNSWPSHATASRNSGETEIECWGTGFFGADTCDVVLYFGSPAVESMALGGTTNDTNSCEVFMFNDTNIIDYSTCHANATGTAVISSITANRIAGTFSFSAYCPYHDGDSVVVTNGTFDLPIFDF